MNMKSLTVILGGISVFALGACTVNSPSSTSTGAGGTATAATTAGNGGAGGGGGATAGTGGTGGVAACSETYTCAEAIDPVNGDPSKLCDGVHGTAYDTLATCTCDAAGKCVTDCGDNACKGMAASAACTACLQSATGCKTEFDACANDI